MVISEAIEKYLLKCKADNLRRETVRDKKRHLVLLSSINKEVELINCDDIYLALSSLNATPIVEWKTRKDWRAFFKYLNETKLSSVPYTLIRNPSVCHRIRPRVLYEEYVLMRKHTKNSRERAILDFLWDTGVRRGELVNIWIKNIDFKEKTFFVETEKNRHTRQGWFTCDLRKYLKEYNPQLKLFEVTDKCVGEIIRRCKQKANINRNITAHAFRHAYASDLLEGGVSLPDTALLCGHSKIQTTMVYYHATNLKREYKKRKVKKSLI